MSVSWSARQSVSSRTRSVLQRTHRLYECCTTRFYRRLSPARGEIVLIQDASRQATTYVFVTQNSGPENEEWYHYNTQLAKQPLGSMLVRSLSHFMSKVWSNLQSETCPCGNTTGDSSSSYLELVDLVCGIAQLLQDTRQLTLVLRTDLGSGDGLV